MIGSGGKVVVSSNAVWNIGSLTTSMNGSLYITNGGQVFATNNAYVYPGSSSLILISGTNSLFSDNQTLFPGALGTIIVSNGATWSGYTSIQIGNGSASTNNQVIVTGPRFALVEYRLGYSHPLGQWPVWAATACTLTFPRVAVSWLAGWLTVGPAVGGSRAATRCW